MIIKDKGVLALIEKTKSSELWSHMEAYAEEDREGRTDMELLENEVWWLVEKFNSEDYIQGETLQDCRRLVRETKHGTVFEGALSSRQLARAKAEVAEAEDYINEYKRIKALERRLNSGLICDRGWNHDNDV